MTEEKKKERKERILKLDQELKRLFPNASIALTYGSPWELLVAVILSAQCTDKKVNEITKTLFKKYPKIEDYVKAGESAEGIHEFEQDIHAAGFFHNKAKNILGAARMVAGEYGGTLPRTMEEMIRIPGVARKTANIILGNVHGVVEGIAVDTHVIRFAIRFDLSDHKDAVKIERDLMELLPREEWFPFTYRVIEYGRQIAPARPYDTSKDPLVKIYPKAGEIFRV